MEGREPLVDDVAAAILDGSTIDWPMVDTASSDAERGLIGELRLLAAVADLHRLQPDTPLLDAAESNAWGHLRLLERVGGGSFGDVYRAHDTRLEREVAVKLIPATRSGDADIADILREGRLLARVRHPGVVTVYDAQQIGHRVGMWMEFVRGRTLEERLEQHGVCTPAEAIDIGIELCRAVAAVHDAGLLHRDIKTQNVMRADDGRLVLMDFGVGRELADGAVTNVAGTPLYLAPEILRGQPATVSTDVYAIGVLLFHILTGSFPVRAKLVAELQRAHETGNRQSLLAARADVPANLAAVIDRAVDPDPARRFGSASDLAGVLATVRPRVRSRRWMLAAAAGLVIAVGAAVAIQRGWIAIGRDAGPLLNPQQWILMSEFTGTTGDAELDAALRHAVTSELEASTYLNVFPPASVRETLERMSRPRNSRIDARLGLEIARHAGLDGIVSGSLDARAGGYGISLRATHVPTGRAVVTPTAVRRSRQDALHAAFGLGRTLREMLGESGPSIEQTSAPLIPVTSQSFEARRDFALGRTLLEQERAGDAVPHFGQAVTRDPDFAMAHLYLGMAYGAERQYDQRDTAIERAATLARNPAIPLAQVEREKILADYHSNIERFEDAAQHMRKLLSLRPGDSRMHGNLGVIYGSLRQYRLAIAEFDAALQRFPHQRVRLMLADMYSAEGRPEAATALLSPPLDSSEEWVARAKHLTIAGHHREASEALAEAEGRVNQSGGRDAVAGFSLAKADFLRSQGHFDSAESVLRQGLARAGGERLELAMASLLVDAGRRVEAIAHLQRAAVGLSRNRIVHGVVAARAGDLVPPPARSSNNWRPSRRHIRRDEPSHASTSCAPKLRSLTVRVPPRSTMPSKPRKRSAPRGR